MKETLTLPAFDNWGVSDTTANITTGPGDILYYTDGAWAPALRVYKRSSGQVLQTVYADGTTTGYGFGDIAVTSDKSVLIGWAQYGWSAGWAGSFLGKFSVAADGRLTFVEKTNSNYPTVMSRDPLETPVLIDALGSKVFVKQLMVSPQAIATVDQTFASPVYTISPGGEVAVTESAVFRTTTGNRLYTLPVVSTIHAITPDYSTLVYYRPTDKTLARVDLFATIGASAMGLNLSPVDGATVSAPSRLEWVPTSGATSYRVYLGTSSAAVSAAGPASGLFLGTSVTSAFGLSSALAPGAVYYWRVDVVTPTGLVTGAVRSFTVSPMVASPAAVTTATVQSHSDHQVAVSLSSGTPGLAWTALPSQPWVTLSQSSGVTPAQITVHLNAAALPTGLNTATIAFSGTGGALFSLPVNLTVEPLKVTLLKSDRSSSTSYAISEDTTVVNRKAYLLELDSNTDEIRRVVEVGNSVTDLAIHIPENRLYVTNWMPGLLRVLNKTTLVTEKTMAFSAFQGTGYGQNDVYRVSPGVAGRLMVEEQDQWIDVDLINTASGVTLSTAFLREGGGDFESTGRYYYHGENNSSGAKLLKYDTSGDVMNSVANIRVSSYSYYGSRVVVVADGGTAVYWNGSKFDANLVEQWTMSAETYSASSDGRLAFGESKIWDTVTKQQVFSMPVTTRISTYNNATGKLIVQVGSRMRFYPVSVSALPAPVLSAGTVTNTTINVEWTDNSLETGFTLQYRPSGTVTWTDVTPAPAANQTSRGITGLSASVLYEVRIKADTPTVSSPWSSVLLLRTADAAPPTITLNNVSWLSGSVRVTYTATGSPTSIDIERSSSTTGPWDILSTAAGTSTSYLDSSVTIGATYYYRVFARRGSAVSGYSQTYGVTIPTPSAYIASIYLTGPVPTLYVSSTGDPVSLVLERSLAAAGPWSVISTFNNTYAVYSDTSAAADTTYFYRVKAISGAYESAYSNVESITTPGPVLPSAPSGLRIRDVSAGELVLGWTDATGETEYLLQRKVGGGSWATLATLPADAVSYNDSTVVQGQAYQYRLAAVNAVGVGAYAVTATIVAADFVTVMEDDFDPDRDSAMWSTTSVLSSVNGGQGFNGTKALWFGGSVQRMVTSKGLAVSAGAVVEFDLRAGDSVKDGTQYWENSDSGEGIVVEYTLDGVDWTSIQQIDTVYPAVNNWTTFSVSLPVGVTTPSLMVRWRQISHSGQGFDCWALDNVIVRSAPVDNGNNVFTTQPEPAVAVEGGSVELSAELSSPNAQYRWFKDGKPVPGTTAPSYVIRGVRPSQAGSYHCVATVDSIEYSSLRVPVIVLQPVGAGSNLRVKKGGRFTLAMRTFPASKASELSYDWYRLPDGGLDGVGEVEGVGTSALVVSSVTEDSGGYYYCNVTFDGVYSTEVGPWKVAVQAAPQVDDIPSATYVVGYPVVIPVHVDDYNARIKVSGLPAGLRYDSASGAIVGNPVSVKTCSVTVEAVNSYGAATPVTFELTIWPLPLGIAGSYQGLIDPVEGAAPHGGLMNLQVTANGTATVAITLGSKTFRSVSNIAVEVGGASGVVVGSIGKADDALRFEVSLAGLPTESGLLLTSDYSYLSDIVLIKRGWSAENPTTEEGRFHLGLAPENESSDESIPVGHGFIVSKNTPEGVAQSVLSLCDGVNATASSWMGAGGQSAVYKGLYGGAGFCSGWVTFQNGEASGALTWSRDAKVSSRSVVLVPGVPAHVLVASGGRYVRPDKYQLLLPEVPVDSPEMMLRFDGGPVGPEFELPVSLFNHQIRFPAFGPGNPNFVVVRASSETGMIMGMFDDTPNQRGTFIACVIPGKSQAAGYFLLSDITQPKAPRRSGLVQLLPVASGE